MAKRTDVVLGVKGEDKASGPIGQVEKKVEGLSKKMKIAAGVMAAASAAMVAGMMSAVKAAGKEEAATVRLSVAMENVGVSYDESRNKLEAWIDANQQATAFADTDQREALATLIRMTGDLGDAQSKLSLAMDIAVGTGKDLASATQLVAYAMGGNWGMVERYIPALKAVVDEQEKWRVLQELFKDQAVEFGGTMAGQFQILEANIGDLKEAFGTALLPAVQSLLEPVKTFVGFMKEHPQLMKFAAGATAIAAALLGVSSAMIMLSAAHIPHFIANMTKMVVLIWTRVIPALSAKLALLMAGMVAMGPAGWIMAGVAAAGIAALAVSIPKLVEGLTKPKATMDMGGTVPGLLGAPVPVMARGGERFSGYPATGKDELHVYLDGVELTDVIYERLLQRKDRNNTLELA